MRDHSSVQKRPGGIRKQHEPGEVSALQAEGTELSYSPGKCPLLSAALRTMSEISLWGRGLFAVEEHVQLCIPKSGTIYSITG